MKLLRIWNCRSFGLLKTLTGYRAIISHSVFKAPRISPSTEANFMDGHDKIRSMAILFMKVPLNKIEFKILSKVTATSATRVKVLYSFP